MLTNLESSELEELDDCELILGEIYEQTLCS